MKKVSIVILGIVSIMFGACNKDTEFKNKLRRDIEKMNSLCPIPMASGTMVSAKYRNDTIFYEVSTEDEFLSTKLNTPLRKQICLLLAKRDSIYSRHMAEHGIYIKWTFKSPNRENSFIITPEVLDEVLDEEMTSKEIADYTLKLIVECENKYKQPVTDGIKSISVYLTDLNLNISVFIDENIINMNDLKDNKEELKSILKEELMEATNNIIDIDHLRLLVATDRGIVYTCTGWQSFIPVSIYFSPKELSEIISTQNHPSSSTKLENLVNFKI